MDEMMSQKEVKRAQVMELLTAGKINQKEAGERLAHYDAQGCSFVQ